MFGGRNSSTACCGLFVVTALLVAVLDGNLPLAVWSLSFWHYYLYWLAFAFGAAPFDVFKRDAVAMKAVSVAALAAVYLAQPLDFVSLAVIAGGILLNVRAAALLGIDRTYYGHEMAGLPHRRLTAFPYSLIGHPMILGNVAAFGGTLINPAFAAHWWPLAGLHVALNLGLLVMELAGNRRLVRIGGGVVFASVLIAATFTAVQSGQASTTSIALSAAATVVCAWTLYRCYAPKIERRHS